MTANDFGQTFTPGTRVYVPDEHGYGKVVADWGFSETLNRRDLGVYVEMTDGAVVRAAHDQLERTDS